MMMDVKIYKISNRVHVFHHILVIFPRKQKKLFEETMKMILTIPFTIILGVVHTGVGFTSSRNFYQGFGMKRKCSVAGRAGGGGGVKRSNDYPNMFDRNVNECNASMLKMSYNNDEEESIPGSVVAAGVVALVVFLSSSIVPGLMAMNAAPSVQGSGLSNAVAVAGKTASLEEGKFERLSRSQIQEKLNRVPVFYISDNSGNMKEEIFVSFDDATSFAKENGGSVKVTTLDQVAYPLVLKRGRMKMSPPPVELSKAEELIRNGDDSISFKFVPSVSAVQAAVDAGYTPSEGQIPLFSADRLAFASGSGPEIPLFFEKADCVTSYKRLRGSSSSSKLPEESTIRVTTLGDQLNSMEKGSLPASRQLQLFSSEYDLIHATELFGGTD